MNPVEMCQCWVEEVVIAHNFCPFAKKEYDQGRILFQLCEEHKFENALQSVIDECRRLDAEETIETTLIIFSEMLKNFDEFWDFVGLAEQLMEMESYKGIYQLASFHPDYCFEGEDENDAANYTNRSPLPMLHLIREKSMQKALAGYPDPASIPENNIIKARQLGRAYFAERLGLCEKPEEKK